MSELSKTARVIAVDLAGRGESEEVGNEGMPTSMDDYADDLAETIASLGGRSGASCGNFHGRIHSFRIFAKVSADAELVDFGQHPGH